MPSAPPLATAEHVAWQALQSLSPASFVSAGFVASALCTCSWWPKCFDVSIVVSCWQYVAAAPQANWSGSSNAKSSATSLYMAGIIAARL